MKKILIVIGAILLLTGCYDYHELNDLEIVSSLIIDYKEDKYVVNIEVLETGDAADTGSFFLEGEGVTLEEAMNNIYRDSALTPFYTHMKSLIISKRVAEAGIDDFFDYLLRDTQFRKDIYIFVTNDVDKILDYETEPKESLGEIARMTAQKNMEQNGRYRTSTFREVIFNYLRDNYYILGNLEVDDGKIYLDDSYLFIDNKLGFTIDPDAALFENILLNINKKFHIYGDYYFEIHGYQASVEVKKDKLVLKIKGHARLLDSTGSSSLSDEELKKLQSDLNDTIRKSGLEIIDYAKRLDHDMFNFNYDYYLHYPNLVMEDTWKNIDYEVESALTISEKGLLLNSLGGIENGE